MFLGQLTYRYVMMEAVRTSETFTQRDYIALSQKTVILDTLLPSQEGI
jgi:hypothetical protein